MSYHPSQLSFFIQTAQRQKPKDELLFERLHRYFIPGMILEIGAGCGQLVELLEKQYGFRVIGSDIQAFFVEYMQSKGLQAELIDATDIHLPTPVENILAQGVSPLITADLGIVEQTYHAIYRNLIPGGRLVFIFPNAYGSQQWSHLRDHQTIFSKVGFRQVALFRHQIFPSVVYGWWPRSVLRALEGSLGERLGIRHILILEK